MGLNNSNFGLSSNCLGSAYMSMSGFCITWSYLLVHIGLLCIACVGIVLNILVLSAMKSTSTATDISRILISNLASGDIASDIVCLYLISYQLVHYKYYYECAFRFGCLTAIFINNIMHLLTLTFDRFFAIAFPYRYVQVFKEKSLKIYCACLWICCGILTILPVCGWRKIALRGVRYCSYFGVMADGYLITIATISCLCIGLVWVCYTSIFIVACQQWKRFRNIHGGLYYWWGSAKTGMILVTFYAFCWIPIGTCVFLHLVGGFPPSFTDDKKGTVAAYCTLPLFLNTIGNPIIYAMKYQTVKNKLLTVCCRGTSTSNRKCLRTVKTNKVVPIDNTVNLSHEDIELRRI